MSGPHVDFDGVWKRFRRGDVHDSLRDLVPAFVRRVMRGGAPLQPEDARYFWALRDVSFHVGAGEAPGIIGPNGAGKSTVLKLLSRVLGPTLGNCAGHGWARALIEVSAGFHPGPTGKENCYPQAASLGL